MPKKVRLNPKQSYEEYLEDHLEKLQEELPDESLKEILNIFRKEFLLIWSNI